MIINQVFAEIGLSDITSSIYTKLLEQGASTARQLAEHIGVPRPSVYDHLKILIDQGLVVEQEKEHKKFFRVNDIKKLPQLIDAKMEILAEEKKALEKELPKLFAGKESIEPRIQFYSGVEGIQRVLKDMLWYEHSETLTMWPISEMVKVLGADYLENLNRKRIQRGISIRGIWPKDKAVRLQDFPFLGVGTGHLRELRLAPSGMNWNMSYWLYGDKVAFISSQQEMFGFIVHSRDFVELQKAQFEVIWKISKPIKPQPQYTDSFLKTLQ